MTKRMITFGATAFVMVAFGVVFAFSQPTVAISQATVNSKLVGGMATAYKYDQQCYERLRDRIKKGESGRTAINNAPSYTNARWLSPYGAASQTTPVIVQYGQQVVHLQLNAVMFLCAALVNPHSKGSGFSNKASNGVIQYDSSKGTYSPIDSAPVSISGNVNYPAMTAIHYIINSAKVTSGGGSVFKNANKTTSLNKTQFATSKNSNSRYWFASPIGFYYFPDSSEGVTDLEMTITITVNTTAIATFYGTTHNCVSGGNVVSSATAFSKCKATSSNLKIKLKIADKYELTPEVSVDDRTGEGTVEAGSGMTIESTVTQGVGDTATSETDWRVTELRYAPGVSLSEADIEAKSGSADPCGARPSANRTYCEIFRRTPDKIFDGSGATETYGYIADDVPVGTRICFVASVSRPTPADDPVWAHSAMVCSVVAKKPKVHILGSDLIVGKGQTSDIYGSRSVRNAGGTRYYGSWAEYAVLASGFVHDFASAAGYSGGTSNNHFCDVSLLTFTNSGTSFCKDSNDSISQGLYNLDSRTLPDVASRFSSSQGISGGTVDVSTANGIYTDSSSGSITVTSSGGAVGKGKSVVIVAPRATVTIDRDINYTTASDLKTMADIPQVVIIADRINIRSNVENVDAWLVATGTNGIINTCSNVTDPVAQLRSTNCNRQLTVNGPVIARHLYLYRTANAGTDANAAEPAEVFNLRPDAYLWATNYSQKAGRLQTVTSKELPPRF